MVNAREAHKVSLRPSSPSPPSPRWFHTTPAADPRGSEDVTMSRPTSPSARVTRAKESGGTDLLNVISEMTKARAAESTTAVSTRSEEHTSELQSLMRISYAVFCLKKKKPPK